ncbi:AMP-dependent synthetase/ligase [Halovenus rubra]|uniref:AMP-dependent synthetase/ligase n=2 Tax=Halovenus rubra TaxID=869890 RepID=A0ABD5XA67_9EURY|nr:long-chain fatty acid--CoA ligase [Halovenus rubra]
MSKIQEPNWLQREREYEDELEQYGTLPELFERSAGRNLDKNAQLYKGDIYTRSLVTADVVSSAPPGEYAALTYREMRNIVRNLATGFREMGLGPDTRVGILSNTRMEWAQVDFGLLAAGCVVTTVYTDSSPTQVEYLLSDPDASAVVVENESLLERVLEVEDDLDLDEIILLDEPTQPFDRDDISTLGEVHELGADSYEEKTYQGWLDETQPDDLASLIYTSGTTGKPKGVQLTHWNFRSNVHQIRRRIGPRDDEPDRLSIDSETRSISFLPLAHVFERLAGHFLMFGSGASVGYAESSDTISEDIVTLEPTTGASVPRVYERIFDSMREQANGGPAGPLKKKIFNWSLEVAKEYQKANSPGPVLNLKHALADTLVYSDVKENLGGNINQMVSGGGSLSKELCLIFNGMGITILEGYGLTETAPVASVNSPDDIRPGTLGVPVADVDIAIDESRDVDEEYEDKDSVIGELLVRGDNVTSGYLNKPGATERAFTDDPFDEDSDVIAPLGLRADGSGKWFRTGDLVEQTSDGFLAFHDRLKQVFVLDTGKNVAPQPIEDTFATNDRIEQIMVLGDNRKFVGALVVPNFERLEEWADSNSVDIPDSRAAMVDDEHVISWIQETIADGNEQFGKHERIKKFALIPEEWTPENDLLTPSMKKKRRSILDVYQDRVNKIYAEDD